MCIFYANTLNTSSVAAIAIFLIWIWIISVFLRHRFAGADVVLVGTVQLGVVFYKLFRSKVQRLTLSIKTDCLV